jgi:hypothetical protein
MKIKNIVYAISFVMFLIMGIYNLHFGANQTDYFITVIALLFVLWYGGFEFEVKEENNSYENK